MWEVFGQFLSGLTTVAISFEERHALEFPSFAFCDSRAYKTRVNLEDTIVQYSEKTFNLDQEVVFNGIMKSTEDKTIYLSINHTTHVVPTVFNGNCKLYEFQQSYPVNNYIGTFTFQY